ncbi:hypothetical protein BH20CHL6_BH20CHL6_15490 [soil metagenome]
MADERIIAEIERYARLDGVPMAHLVREAMDRYVSSRGAASTARLPSFAGLAEGTDSDVASRDEEILRREWPDHVHGSEVDAGDGSAGG